MSPNVKPPGYLAPHLRGNPLYDPAAKLSTLSLGASSHGNSQARTNNSTRTPKRSPGLFDLSGEIRNEIYRYALVAARNRAAIPLLPRDFRGPRAYCLGTGILQANRQTNREASSIFYGENILAAVRGSQISLDNFVLCHGRTPIFPTNSTRNQNRVALLLHVVSSLDPPIGHRRHPNFQINFFADDFESFCINIYESVLLSPWLAANDFTLHLTEFWSALPSDIKQASWNHLGLIGGPRLPLTDISTLEHIAVFSCTVEKIISAKSFEDFLFYIEKRAIIESQEGNHASATRIWERIVDDYKKGLSLHRGMLIITGRQQRTRSISWGRHQAEALIKLGEFMEAEQVLRFAILRIRSWSASSSIAPSTASAVYRMLGVIYETRDTLYSWKKARDLYWTAHRYDPSDSTIAEKIEFLDEMIFKYDRPMW